jgi:hypothetical protein
VRTRPLQHRCRVERIFEGVKPAGFRILEEPDEFRKLERFS